jgi:hypothetical protein
MGTLHDLVGQRFGRWTVIERGPNIKRRAGWICRCDCGEERAVESGNLVTGRSTSCGCGRLERTRTHGATGSAEYGTWTAMKSRCYGTSNAGYPTYGARGITVCDAWHNDFVQFLRDMGPKPSDKHTLDRIDPNGNYEPSNCRWALPNMQSNNRRNNRHLTFKGKTQTVSEWAREVGLRKNALLYRLESGWDLERALTTPSRRG